MNIREGKVFKSATEGVGFYSQPPFPPPYLQVSSRNNPMGDTETQPMVVPNSIRNRVAKEIER